MSRLKPLAEHRRCAGRGLSTDPTCQNYTNMKTPRRLFWPRGGDEVMCWAYVCDACYAEATAYENDEPWPMDSGGRFMESVECSLL